MKVRPIAVAREAKSHIKKHSKSIHKTSNYSTGFTIAGSAMTLFGVAVREPIFVGTGLLLTVPGVMSKVASSKTSKAVAKAAPRKTTKTYLKNFLERIKRMIVSGKI